MRAYSEDLRERVIRGMEAGLPRDEVAGRFEVSVPTSERPDGRRGVSRIEGP